MTIANILMINDGKIMARYGDKMTSKFSKQVGNVSKFPLCWRRRQQLSVSLTSISVTNIDHFVANFYHHSLFYDVILTPTFAITCHFMTSFSRQLSPSLVILLSFYDVILTPTFAIACHFIVVLWRHSHTNICHRLSFYDVILTPTFANTCHFMTSSSRQLWL